MKSRILKCTECNRYTLKTSCPYCGAVTINPRPARYSPEDRYGAYRRRMKKFHDDDRSTRSDR
ncbi:MAG: RNA-protein complex protein Nop10 [Euryarchaeota archaeon]|nr:RNA-protein complex protein Nop10 [Euryarchaeota archaeon]